jgi:hypothetical protein
MAFLSFVFICVAQCGQLADLVVSHEGCSCITFQNQDHGAEQWTEELRTCCVSAVPIDKGATIV